MSTAGNPGNYMNMFLQAAVSSQAGILNQQLADTLTTQGLATIESNLNKVWNSPDVVYYKLHPVEGILSYYSQIIQNLVAQYQKNPNQTIQEEISAAQSAYQVQSAAANASTSNADSLVQTSQSQSQQDSSNLQNLLQVVQAAMSLMSAIASLLSK